MVTSLKSGIVDSRAMVKLNRRRRADKKLEELGSEQRALLKRRRTIGNNV